MRKKAWGTDHMIRSGKRHDDDWYPGVVVDQEVPDNLYRVSRSGISRNSWGGVHITHAQNWHKIGTKPGFFEIIEEYLFKKIFFMSTSSNFSLFPRRMPVGSARDILYLQNSL